MGSVCCCFNVNDPVDDHDTDDSNHDNWFILNLYNKIKQYAASSINGQTHSLNTTPNGELVITQSGSTSSQHPPGHSNLHHQDMVTSLLNQEGGLINQCHSQSELGVLPYIYASSSKYEDECPTCLEEYTPENPRITAQCSHHYHLGCIYEWMERSQTCPICNRVMIFNETC